jgi:cob(I)alamin adenosyltransferase
MEPYPYYAYFVIVRTFFKLGQNELKRFHAVYTATERLPLPRLGPARSWAGDAGLHIQFLRWWTSGEHLAAGKLAPYLTIIQTGSNDWCRKSNPSPEDIRLAREALNLAEDTLTQGRYDLVILDEINYAVHYNLVSVDDVLHLIEQKPPRVELVLTGRNAHERIMAAADLVTEMREIKHYYKAGVAARTGIEK